VKNLFVLQYILFSTAFVHLQVLLTRLTPVDNTGLFLKLSGFDNNRLVAFHSFTIKKVSHCKESVREMHKSGVDLDSFLPLQTDGCYQLILANCRQMCRNSFDARHQNLLPPSESISMSNCKILLDIIKFHLILENRGRVREKMKNKK
jgi:hypothetical protein